MTSTDRHSQGRDHDEVGLDNPTVMHEDSDIDVATVLKFGVGLFVTVVVCAVVVWGAFRFLERGASARDPQVSPLARPAGQLPPGPRLETNEPGALAAFRAEEEKALGGYGWVNQLGGVTRIPIAEAKKLLVQRGLPTRTGGADALEGTRAQATGEASGGRTIPKPATGPPVPPAGAPAPGAAAPAAPVPARPGEAADRK
jgi:hypothetical protein